MQCERARNVMHDALDGELDAITDRELRTHLSGCPDCARKFETLKQTETFLHVHVTSSAREELSDDQEKLVFQQRLRAYRLKRHLPPPKKTLLFKQWLKKRGGAIFVAIALGALIGAGSVHIWHEIYNKDVLMVQGESLHELVIEKQSVMVPSGKIIEGDLIVRHGDVKVFGHIKGNLTVIDGYAEIANNAKIEGNVKTINHFIDWLK